MSIIGKTSALAVLSSIVLGDAAPVMAQYYYPVPQPYYRPYYGPAPYYGYPPPHRYEYGGGRNCYPQYGICCPPHFTVQDGVCKPYRGF